MRIMVERMKQPDVGEERRRSGFSESVESLDMSGIFREAHKKANAGFEDTLPCH
jgi:hypothetical protein